MSKVRFLETDGDCNLTVATDDGNFNVDFIEAVVTIRKAITNFLDIEEVDDYAELVNTLLEMSKVETDTYIVEV